MACRKQPKPIHQLTSAQFEKLFPDEPACCAYLVARRWPNGVSCPRCGAGTFTSLKPWLSSGSAWTVDQYPGYNPLDKDYPHTTIDHARGQYVIGAIHTQTIEGFWSIFKRGVVGTFHKMSRKYMPLYVAEFQFRYNNRENVDIFGSAIKGC
jgi:hypothetical protein